MLKSVGPHLMLFIIYMTYLLAGGGVFMLLEGGQEVNDPGAVYYYELTLTIDSAMTNLTEGKALTTAKNLSELWLEYTEYVERFVVSNRTRTGWTFTGSVLFCATTISTIGYGDIVPVSVAGRVTVVLYALIGIPLTLTFLADIGGLLARLVIWIVGAWSSIVGHPNSSTAGHIPTLSQYTKTGLKANKQSNPCYNQCMPATELHTMDERGIPEMRITLGIFQDSTPQSELNDDPVNLTNDAVATSMDEIAPDRGNHAYPDVKSCDIQAGASVMKTAPVDNVTDSANRVPVLVVTVILVVYTFMGALMIAYIEGWYYGEALYFTFITLTTIGFGDFVPQKHVSDTPSFFGCLAYTIIGLAVMSMCITLVQSKVVRVVYKAAHRLGF